MPTFQSIPIHPSVRSRLLRCHVENNVDSSDSNCQESGPQQQQQQQPARSGVSIPRSLLTRDLSDLVDMFSVGDIKNEQQRAGILVEIEKIRCQVARRMISKTRNGKRLLHNNQHDQQCGEMQKKRRPLIPGGSLNALDAWNSQREGRWKDQDHCRVFSTGCSDLDNLIAFPMEYFFEPSDNRDEIMPCNVDLAAGEVKGLPRGYVLKISGTSGKTQLAIQLVSQVMVQSFRQLKGKSKRIRYCFSTAGHSGYSLAKRLFEHIDNNIEKNEGEILKHGTKNIEFQPIATISQLISTVAKLEEEFLRDAASNSLASPLECDDEVSHHPSNARRQGTVSMLVLDALPLMIAEKEDTTTIQSLERWLKRLARNYSMLVVVVTASGGGGSLSIYNNAMSPDIHLQLQKRTPTTLSVHLMRHPAKPVTEKEHITYTPPKYNL